MLVSISYANVWQEDGSKRSMVFLVTFAAVLEETAAAATTPLRTLEGLTRENVRDAVLDAVANPAAPRKGGGRPRTVPAASSNILHVSPC